MNILIRKAELEDLVEIQNLNRILFELEYKNFDETLDISWPISKEGTNYFKNSILNNITLVAVINNKIIGYLVGSLNTQYSYNKTIQAELDNMCILEEYRKMGIGKKLFLEFKNICNKNGVNEIKVIASYKNNNAINFYKSNGFEEAEIILKASI